MAQSSLVGGLTIAENGEGARKRLKISVPHFDNSDLIKGYAKMLIRRCMNPAEQNIKSLVDTLPRIWHVEGRVVGADLGLGKFQFDFDNEEDIEAVLKMQQFHYDYWMLSLVRWQPRQPKNYPSEIIFWVRVLGVPHEFWAYPTFESIGNAIGKTIDVDEDLGRVKVLLDGYKELTFETSIDFAGGEFHDGEEALISLRYEKLFGYCESCFSLCHITSLCPLTKSQKAASKPEVEQVNREEYSGYHNDKARSYKTVVSKGHGGHQALDKGAHHHGKGKGKGYDPTVERSLKSTYGQRHRSRRDDDRSRFKYQRKEEGGHSKTEGDRNESRRDTLGDAKVLSESLVESSRKGALEDGEILVKDNSGDKASVAFQLELEKTQQIPMKVGQMLLEEDADFLDHNMEAPNGEMDFSLSDADMKLMTEEDGNEEGEEALQLAENVYPKDIPEASNIDALKDNHDVVKKPPARKKLFKPSVGVGVSNKMRMVHGLASPQKKNTVKISAKQGDGTKISENRGALASQPGASST